MEYIIVNKTTLEKRIAELRFLSKIGEDTNPELVKATEYRINEIELMSSQSTPLIPEIKKAFDAGRFTKEYKEEFTKSEIFDLECQGINYDPNLHYHNNQKYEFKDKQEYISNLKLDI